MMILISGASGLIGSALVPALEGDGHSITRLVRSAPRRRAEIQWTPGEPIHPTILEKFDAVIHLAARSIGTRWTEKLKREARASRVVGTRTISEAVGEAYVLSGRPHTLISAAAVGYYGSRGDEVLTEESSAGSGFLAEVAQEWEAATKAASEGGVRVVLPRISMVLSAQGGGLPKMLTPFRMGVGGRIGSGQQWMSWIAIEDVVEGIRFALQNQAVRGPVNFTAPEPVTNSEFVRKLGNALHRPAVFPLPAFVVKLVMGEMGESLLLASIRAVPKRLQQAGYQFRHPELEDAFRSILS